jgi:hypothetical protein
MGVPAPGMPVPGIMFAIGLGRTETFLFLILRQNTGAGTKHG